MHRSFAETSRCRVLSEYTFMQLYSQRPHAGEWFHPIGCIYTIRLVKFKQLHYLSLSISSYIERAKNKISHSETLPANHMNHILQSTQYLCKYLLVHVQKLLMPKICHHPRLNNHGKNQQSSSRVVELCIDQTRFMSSVASSPDCFIVSSSLMVSGFFFCRLLACLSVLSSLCCLITPGATSGHISGHVSSLYSSGT